MIRSLIDIAQQSKKIALALSESGGELTPNLENELDLSKEQLPEKIDGYQHIMDYLEGERLIWKQRKYDCETQEKKFAKIIETMKDRIRIAMSLLETDELYGNIHRFKLINSKPKLIIHDDNLIPETYKIVTQIVSPDKDKIRADLEAGMPVPGAELRSDGALRSYMASKKKE